MTYNWVKDISDMHDKFGVKAWFEENKGDRERSITNKTNNNGSEDKTASE